MKKKDINVILEILNDKADDFQQEVNFLRNCNEDLNSLIDNVSCSNLCNDDKDKLKGIISLNQWKNTVDAVELSEKIDSIDMFVSAFNKLPYDDDDLELHVTLGWCLECVKDL